MKQTKKTKRQHRKYTCFDDGALSMKYLPYKCYLDNDELPIYHAANTCIDTSEIKYAVNRVDHIY